MPEETSKAKNTQSHIHGCGHPVRPVVLCDDPFSLIMSGWLDWYEENDCGEPSCICYFCWRVEWEKSLQLKNKKREVESVAHDA